MEINKYGKKLVIWLFQLSVISIYTLDLSTSYYTISKGIILAFFFVSVVEMIATNFKLTSIILMPVYFFLVVCVSYLWAVDKSLVLPGIITQFQYLLLFLFTFYVMRTGGKLEDYYNSLYVAGFFLVFLTIYEYGIDEIINYAVNGRRLGGIIGNENLYGMAFAQSALVAFYYFLNKRKIHLFSFILFIFFAVSSGSKKAGLIIFVGIGLIVLRKYGIKNFGKLIVALALLVVLIIYISRLSFFSMIIHRFKIMLSGESSSDAYRLDLILSGLKLFITRPIWGYGYDNYQVVSGYGVYSHNNFIELAVNLGIVGLFFYYMIYGYSFFAFAKEIFRAKESAYELILIFLVIEFFMGVGAVQFVEKTIWVSFGVYLSSLDYITQQNKSVLKKRAKVSWDSNSVPPHHVERLTEI